MNDYIEIDNLIVFANHGVFSEEETMGQRFMISLKLYADICVAATTDEISHSINYGEVCEFVTDFTKTHRAKLIEKAAQDIAYALLDKYELLKKVEVQLKKPWAPIGLPLDNVLVNITRSKNIVYIGLGSNMGDKKAYLDFAIDEINKHPQCKVLSVSDYILTKPVGDVVQGDFLNACAKIETVLPPDALLAMLNRIEEQAGRERIVHWGPRTLDLDILLYGDEVIDSEKLTIPHKEMAKRAFVLKPLTQIAPYAYHPVKRKYVCELLEELQ